MKNFIAGILCAVILMFSTIAFAEDGLKKIEAYLRPDLSITLDGNKLVLENSPIIYEGSTYLPLRELASIVGLNVGWDEGTQTARLITKEALLPTVQSEQVPVNDTVEKKLEILKGYLDGSPEGSAIKYNGNIFLPVRYSAEKYNLRVTWDGKSIGFEGTDVSVNVSENITINSDGLVYQGGSYIKESVIFSATQKHEKTKEEINEFVKRNLSEFKDMINFKKKELTQNIVYLNASFKDRLNQKDFQDYWENLDGREHLLTAIAKEEQKVNQEYDFSLWIYYGNVHLATVQVSKDGNSYISFSSNPFPDPINQ